MSYTPTIGLEIHAELKTLTKMFCDSANDPNERDPNTNVCPVCMGHPGTLPTINKEAVKKVLLVGVALGGEIADFTEFDRKNYFYPDLPKGYQISQYKYPLVSGGSLRNISITRVHLEEDTARSMHAKGDESLVDFNRAGIPLMELVTEPVIQRAEDAGAFARELQLLLRYLDISGANMEKGEMRVEANISVSRDDSFGTKVEVKNLNSFRSVERAIAFEIDRQVKLLEGGGEVVQETRGWDENKNNTFSQRIKEESSDYRYFPDPDLPKLKLSEVPEFAKEVLESEMPELPWQRRARYRKEYGLKDSDVETIVNNPRLAVFFEETADHFSDTAFVQTVANFLISDLVGLLKSEKKTFSDIQMSAEHFVSLMSMYKDEQVSSRGVKDILIHIVFTGGDPKSVAEARGLLQQSDTSSLEPIIEKIVKEHQTVAEDYRGGKEASLQFLVGQVMKDTKGSANPQIVQEILKRKLS